MQQVSFCMVFGGWVGYKRRWVGYIIKFCMVVWGVLVPVRAAEKHTADLRSFAAAGVALVLRALPAPKRDLPRLVVFHVQAHI